MVKVRRPKTQGTIKQELAGGGREQILATHNLRDFHRRVVNHHRELISRNVVVPPNHKIAKILTGYEALRAAAAIHEADILAIRNVESPVDSAYGMKLGSCRLGI